MKPFFPLVSAGILFFYYAYAGEPDYSKKMILESHTVLATDQVPFWLEMNRLGQVDDQSRVQQIFLFDWRQSAGSRNAKFFFDYGASLAGRLSGESSIYAEQYWGRIRSGRFYLLAGAKAEPLWEGGLSHTNGNFFLSNNARPNPRVELGVENFPPVRTGWFNRFSFDVSYSEYFLLDDRIVDNANLHHKRVMINYRINRQFTFHAGLDHWVFWGGTSPDSEIGKIPGFKYYLRYILGRGGGKNSPETDQNNKAGNQLGQNLFQLDFKQPDYELKVYYQHLFEDGSGFLFHNIQDGFWGISFRRFKEKPLVQRVIIEYMNTMNQSGPYHKYAPDPSKPDLLIGKGRDNYFNHGVYRSGFVSYNRMIGSPLFVPTVVDGVSTGFESTRVQGIHGGMDGYLSEQVYWSGRGTYSRYYGRYDAPFSPCKELLSLEVDLSFRSKRLPVTYVIKVAADLGSYQQTSWGCEFSFRYRIR